MVNLRLAHPKRVKPGQGLSQIALPNSYPEDSLLPVKGRPLPGRERA